MEEWYYFTFGYGHHHEGYCVKIWGTYESARRKMFERYGNKWAFQYSTRQWKEVAEDPERWWPMEKVLEVVG